MDANIRWTKGRGATKFCFTYEDLVKITGLNINTLRQYAWNKKRGKGIGFNPKELSSVVFFLAPYLLKGKWVEILREATKDKNKNDTNDIKSMV